MKITFHVHTSESPDSTNKPSKLWRAQLRYGVDVVTLTDHDRMAESKAYAKAHPGRVIVGEEVSSKAGHIIGLFLDELIPSGLSVKETMQRIKDQGGLVYVPHPCLRIGKSVSLCEFDLEETKEYIDILETFNARCATLAQNNLVNNFARRHGIAAVSAPDAHFPFEVGRVVMDLPELYLNQNPLSPETLMRQLPRARIAVKAPTSLFFSGLSMLVQWSRGYILDVTPK